MGIRLSIECDCTYPCFLRCWYSLWLSWVNSYLISQNFSVSTRGPIYPLLFKREGLRYSRGLLVFLYGNEWFLLCFSPFLHLHLPVQISPSGEDPSSYQGAGRALARVVTSFASEKLLSSLLSKWGVSAFKVKRFFRFSRNWAKEGRNLRKSGVALNRWLGTI